MPMERTDPQDEAVLITGPESERILSEINYGLQRGQIPFESTGPRDEVVSITGPESERILSEINYGLQRRFFGRGYFYL